MLLANQGGHTNLKSVLGRPVEGLVSETPLSRLMNKNVLSGYERRQSADEKVCVPLVCMQQRKSR